MTYSILGLKGGEKVSKRVESLIAYIGENYTKKGNRLGFENLVKRFSKWEEEKGIVFASSMPTYADVQQSCFIVASSIAIGEVMPIFTSDSGKNGVISTIEKTEENFNRLYGKNGSRKSAFDPSKLIIGLLNSEKYDFTSEMLDAIQDALDARR